MAALTPKQITALGDNFLTYAQAVGDYRIAHYDALTATQRQELKKYQKLLLDRADELYTTSAMLIMDEVEAPLNSVKDITAKMETTYSKLRNVQKVINIAAACVKMGSSIFSLNGADISQSISDLLTLFNESKSIRIKRKKS